MPFYQFKKRIMRRLKDYKYTFVLLLTMFFVSSVNAEQEEIYLQSISDQIQVITKDLKTLEKAVYQKSDVTSSSVLSSIKSDGLNEDIMTKHLLKLNEIEDQFRELTNRFEEVNFKLDKLSTRVTKIQSDTQLRFSDLENGIDSTTKEKKVSLPGSAKPQDFGAAPGYQTTNLPKEQSINSIESAQTVITEEPEKKEPMSLDEAEKANLNNVNAQDLLKQVEDPFKIPEAGIRLRPGEEDNPFVKTQSEQKEMSHARPINLIFVSTVFC